MFQASLCPSSGGQTALHCLWCPVVAVIMLESRVARCVQCEEEVPPQCTNLATRLSNITTATTGQKTIGSETQSDLLMMGMKTPETC